ncbi:TadE/TadG family type IV pilus assembly protein [Streptosporangium sp. NPDC048865]|uniref:TadE/TadG family type IV pilus assembly protein n=1 Tax=Streptosporangium sp. NPDC048865 TaxID=3155766 RepID=UPI003412CA02
METRDRPRHRAREDSRHRARKNRENRENRDGRERDGVRDRAGRPRRGARQGTGGRDGERGATVVELAIIMPVLLVVVLLIVQSALWFHGRQIADAAAREGARLARADTESWQQDAESRAQELIRTIGPKLLEGATVTAWEEGDRRGVEVTASAVQVVPLLPSTTFTVTARFGGPIECFRPDDGSEGCE